MYLSRVLLRSGSFSPQTAKLLRSSVLRKQPTLNNSGLIPRRSLMSSVETGGLRSYQAPRRIKANVKAISAVGMGASAIIFYYSLVKEDEINEALGTNWNTSAIAMSFLLPLSTVCGFLLFCPTTAL